MAGLSLPQSFTSKFDKLVLSPSKQTPEIEHRDARLVTSISLVTVIAMFSRLFFGIDTVFLISFIIVVFAYIFSRTQYRNISSIILVVLLAAPSFAQLTTFPVNGAGITSISDWVVARASWLLIPMVLSGIFFSWRGTFIYGITLAVMLALFPSFNSDIVFNDMISAFAIVLVITILLALAGRHRDAVEADRRAVLIVTNENLEEARNNLEERTLELAKALKAAQYADKVKSAFLASMSHELRTPLNSVINYSKFVVKGVMGPVTERQEETLNKVVASGQHLLSLINDVLDMSKIESGSLTLFIEDDLNLNTILDTAISSGESLLHEKPVNLEQDIQANLPMMRGDRKRITQILLNIVSNACKFTEEGLVKIRASVEEGNLLVSVQDTGPGIAEKDRELVFSSFKQTGTGLRQGEGTGLGMPISKNLAEAHGGKLWFESEVGKGSTFYVKLPIQSETLQVTV